MSLYVIEEKLSSSTNEKFSSAALALVISMALVFILWFLRISVPNPPFEIKQGVVELDFGLVDAGFGQPDQGGPSPTPPAQGGDNGGGGGGPVQSGGYGPTTTNDASSSDVSVSQNNPPVTETQSEIAKRWKNSGTKRTGTQPGDPNGFPGGTGRTGSGPGGQTGVTGNGGTRPGGVGNGVFSYNFTNFKLSSSVTKVNADGEGNIVCRVSVDCAGRASVVEYGSRGTNYTGSESNMRQVFDYFISRSTFTKTGEKCPESGLVTLTVKTTI